MATLFMLKKEESTPSETMRDTASGTGGPEEVDLYRWPWGQPKLYVTKRVMLRKLLLTTLALTLSFGLGALYYFSVNEPRIAPVVQEKQLGKEAIKQCCLQDIRATQEALTAFSVEAQKLRVRTGTNKDPVTQKLLTGLTILSEQPKSVWDQLESFVDDPNENKRRQLRDLRITMEGLKEQFAAFENCCGAPAGLIPPLMKEYFQIAAYRFGVVHHTIETSFKVQANHDAETNGKK